MTPITRREFVKRATSAPLALSAFGNNARAAMPAERFDVVVAGATKRQLGVEAIAFRPARR
jgi:hypothetical protein